MQSRKDYKRVVVKIGSSILCRDNKLDKIGLKNLVEQVCLLLGRGVEVILVSSGAVSSGMATLDLKLRPSKIDNLQACASLGQGVLMQNYINVFLSRGKHCGQLLLTWDDFDNRSRYLNAKNTILSLLKYKAIPIINENDTVAIEEMQFGDNDNLSALVAIMVKADLLIILSDVEGLYDKKGTCIPLVSKVTPQIKKLASPTKKTISKGGMITKLEAAEKVNNLGIACLVANGRTADVLSKVVLDKKMIGTTFLPGSGKFCAKLSWIAYSAKPKGKICVDQGAKDALVDGRKSLLSVGVFKIEGRFKKGDIVSISNKYGKEFARGTVTCSAEDLNFIKGKRYKSEIIHRDNLVII